MFDYSALRLRNAGFSSGVQKLGYPGVLGVPSSAPTLPRSDRIFFNPNNTVQRFAAYRLLVFRGSRGSLDRSGHLCNQQISVVLKLLDMFQVITFWQLQWIVFCNVQGAVKRHWTICFWRNDRKIIKVQKILTVCVLNGPWVELVPAQIRSWFTSALISAMFLMWQEETAHLRYRR